MIIRPFVKTYDDRTALKFPGIELERGKIYGIIGANGSGKSTFAKVSAGIIPADKKGALTDVSVGYMPQSSYAFSMSVKKNIMLGAGRETDDDLFGLDNEKRAEMLMDVLQIRHLEKKRADRLSGGETSRMALARLMMKKFDILILDEPVAAMDIETTCISEEMMKRYVEETSCALVLISHDIQQTNRLADEVMYFHKGELLENGPKEKVLKRPEKEETKTFLKFYGLDFD